ncbi:hypothetical protein FSARC_10687 [Fusarium sarcochroum]|uniref:SGNH hydrolase-type esterase domain-containing protein n=1 Tax=Fusarium sarcochroum TaxID=1208366 RepID=A0A8H4TKL5_9HYPO|nr:hypothetical protein FSARC_10687 [Fusarium sarcochroum]
MLLSRFDSWLSPFTALLFILSSIPKAATTGLAGGHERIVFYYTYRMAVQAYGKDQNNILPDRTVGNQLIDCAKAGSHPDGGCNFLEFVNRLNNQNLNPDAFEGVDLKEPDPIKGANALWSIRDPTANPTGRISVNRLFARGTIPYEDVVAATNNLVKKIHKELKEDGRVKQIERYETKIKDSMKEIVTLRQSDMNSNQAGNKGIVEDIKTMYSGAKPVFDQTKYEHDSRDPDRQVFDLNFQKTIDNSPKGTFPSIQALTQWAGSSTRSYTSASYKAAHHHGHMELDLATDSAGHSRALLDIPRFTRRHGRDIFNEPLWASEAHHDLVLSKRDFPVQFRILGTGSSSAQGTGSDPLDGYRLELKNLLRGNGAAVSFTGPFCDGMEGGNHAGVGGDTIGMTRNRAVEANGWRNLAPNLVIINAGSNNCADDGKLKEEAGPPMKQLLDAMLKTPNTVILVSLVHQVRTAARNQCIREVNRVIAEVSSTYSSSKVRTVDLFGKLNLAANEYADSIHVNNAGYKKMAKMYYDAILDMDVSDPSADADKAPCDSSGGTGNDTCEKKDAKITQHLLLRGSGWNDGRYIHKGHALGRVMDGLEGGNGKSGKKIRFADLNGDSKDDYTFILRDDGDSDSAATLHIRRGQTVDRSEVKWGKAEKVSLTSFCGKDELFEWGDVDGDGLADMICITTQGGLRASRNLFTNSTNTVKFGAFVNLRGPTAGYTQKDVMLGDIDGDGRVDILLVDSKKEVISYRNSGPTPGMPLGWQALGNVFHGAGAGNRANWRLVDLNGDGRADWLTITNEGGRVRTWINHRGHSKGSLRPVWDYRGITHTGVGKIEGYTVKPELLSFPHLTSNRADYAFSDIDGNVTLWRNDGQGGARLKGDGVRFCDMYGTGTDDYVWIYHDGKMVMWEHTKTPGSWKAPVTISEGVNARQTGITRERIHLADMTGNGRCDLLHVSLDGSVRLWENNLSKNNYNWIDRGTIFNAAKIGGGECDPRGIRFADLDGDGKMDYICLNPAGKARIWLSPKGAGAPKSGTWRYVGETTPFVGKERENIKLADINGDGFWDFLWVDKFTGAVDSATNKGAPASGSTWKPSWNPVTRTSTGVARGGSVQFANVNPRAGKRADYIAVRPDTARSYAWFNECPGGSGTDPDDDGNGSDDDPPNPPIENPGGDKDDDEGDTSFPAPDTTPLECLSTYKTLDDVVEAVDEIPSFCRATYLISALADLMLDTLDRYEDVKDGYEGKFEHYVGYVKDIIEPQLSDWMSIREPPSRATDTWGEGNRFFDCKHWSQDDDEDGEPGYSGQCPPPNVGDGWESWRIEYTLRDKNGFNEALVSELGIQPDWVVFEEWDSASPCVPDTSTGGTTGPCLQSKKVYTGFPRKADDDDIEVPDPQDVVEKAIDNIVELETSYQAAALSIGLGTYSSDKDFNDAIWALAMPVQLVRQAVDHMDEVSNIGEELEEQEKKNMIMLIISVVLAVVPFVGEIGFALAGFVQLARITMIAGEAANLAFSIAEVIDDPSSAPMAVLGMLLTPLGAGRRLEDSFADATAAKRLMSSSHITKMGPTFKRIDDKVRKVVDQCIL